MLYWRLFGTRLQLNKNLNFKKHARFLLDNNARSLLPPRLVSTTTKHRSIMEGALTEDGASATSADVTAPISGDAPAALTKNQLKRAAKAAELAEKEKKKAEKLATEKAAPPPAPSAAPKKAAIERYDYVNTTPPGQKKNVSEEMLPAYHPQVVEAAWDSWWTAQGYYSADPVKAQAAGEEGRFVMVIPPPNVTGSLHLGHALTSAVEDSLTRWHRMHGRPTMWLPGTDHAGIATQSVVEKRLKKERNITRHDLGRDAFLKEVWAWKETYGANITKQLRHLAVSTDWSREAFTMDANLNRAVKEAFVRMHESGLVYRDNRLVNWCCQLQSAISNEEVDKLELEGRKKLPVPGHNPNMTYEFGLIWSVAYKVADSETGEELIIATTRPETLLGDTAVAVHPNDPRYSHLHGKFLVHPFDGRRIPVITDGLLVDMSYGSGAVKVTPAHDENDFKCGKRHGLPFITVIDEDGKMSPSCVAPFAGMMRYDCRYAICKALEEKGLLRDKKDNKMALSVCSRTGDIIEPLMKPQWYVKCDSMAKRASDAVRNGELRLLPEDLHHGVWFHYMDNIRDWCVSRQLWWGHRIPAYFAKINGRAAGGDDASSWFVARSEEEAMKMAVAKFGVPESSIQLQQDEDVLDTWFSSGLFPFSTFGWPDETHPDYKAFYPNTLLETGHDILFFWVARMVMMGLQLTDKLPFKTVYLHAMVRDKEGRKMSKSKGNVIDPMEVIYGCDLETLHQKVRDGNLPAKEVEVAIKGQRENFPEGIPECGADALRFGLLAYTIQGRDINLDVSRVVSYRQFCNKLWNATRFTLTHLAPDRYTPKPMLDTIDELLSTPSLAVRDRWILSRLNACIESVDVAMKAYTFGNATSAIYNFFLYEFCDYYLELLKPLFGGPGQTEESAKLASASAGGDVALAQRLARSTLHVCLELGLRLLHPMMPMLTEELWQRLPGRGLPQRAVEGAPKDWPSIMIAQYPISMPTATKPEVEAAFALFQEIIRAGRSLRSDYDIVPSKSTTMFFAASDAASRAIVDDQISDIKTLLKCESLTVVSDRAEVPSGCSAYIVNDRISVYLQLKGLIDPQAEIVKLGKKQEKLKKEIETLQKRKASPGYVEKVPEAVRITNDESLARFIGEQQAVLAMIEQYKTWDGASS
jgi:valyl-tRNA synthetase